MQNRAARIVSGIFDWNMFVSKLIRDLGWMNVKTRRDYFILLIMYKCIKTGEPTYLNDTLIYVNNCHTQNTRSASNNVLVLPKPNIELFKTSLVYKGPQLWNNLPHDIQCVSDVSVFKECLKTCLMKQ